MGIENRAGVGSAKKLLQAAALAAALVPLGAIDADAATIDCTVQGACSGDGGSYTSDASGHNIWKFYDNDFLAYTFEVSGFALTDFTLFVSDTHVSVDVDDDFALPTNVQCIPLYDEFTCVIFDVFAEGTVEWDANGYYILMTWFAPEGPTVLRPPDDGRNHIYRSEDGFSFTERLQDSDYDPFPNPFDPALGGRGDTFSSFIAAREVPEPGALLLLGGGLAAALCRRRRR
jgi:hypothetical protein